VLPVLAIVAALIIGYGLAPDEAPRRRRHRPLSARASAATSRRRSGRWRAEHAVAARWPVHPLALVARWSRCVSR
jgi:hypothetical protein